MENKIVTKENVASLGSFFLFSVIREAGNDITKKEILDALCDGEYLGACKFLEKYSEDDATKIVEEAHTILETIEY